MNILAGNYRLAAVQFTHRLHDVPAHVFPAHTFPARFLWSGNVRCIQLIRKIIDSMTDFAQLYVKIFHFFLNLKEKKE
jgi:hypothetical protein